MGCIFDAAECPELKPLDLYKSGQYTAAKGEPVNWNCSSGCSTVFTPHDGVEDLTLDLNIEQDIVTIRFRRDGKDVVERWRVRGRQSH